MLPDKRLQQLIKRKKPKEAVGYEFWSIIDNALVIYDGEKKIRRNGSLRLSRWMTMATPLSSWRGWSMALKLPEGVRQPSAVKPPPHSNKYYGYKKAGKGPTVLDKRVKRQIIP